MKRLINKYKKFIRFIFVGGFNTLTSYVIYYALLFFFPYFISYSVAFFLGIIVSYYLNTILVFKSYFSLKKFLSFPFVYLAQYLLNMFFLYILVEKMHYNIKLAPIVGIIVTMPFTYLLSKFVLQDKFNMNKQ